MGLWILEEFETEKSASGLVGRQCDLWSHRDSLLFGVCTNKWAGQLENKNDPGQATLVPRVIFSGGLTDCEPQIQAQNRSKTNQIKQSVPNSSRLGKLAWHFKTYL